MKPILLVLLLVCCLLPMGAAAESVGTVKTVSGQALVDRQGQLLVAVAGMPIFAQDQLMTQADSSLGVILKDDTSLSLGSQSQLLIREYVFEPKSSTFSVVLKMLKGTFLYMSGVIGKLAPEAIQLETPESTIAVRGTRLLVKVSR